MHQWIPLLDRFDEYLAAFVAPRRDVHLRYNATDCGGGDGNDGAVQEVAGTQDPPFPSHTVLEVLRVVGVILTNCSNTHLFSSVDHLALLLAAPETAVVLATLQARMNRRRRLHASGSLRGSTTSL